MSKATMQIVTLVRELEAKIAAIPPVAGRTAYANLLHRLRADAIEQLEIEQEMDYEKSMDRC